MSRHYIQACRVEEGYTLAARIIQRTPRGVRITDDIRTAWLPRKCVWERDGKLYARDWIIEQRARDFTIIDPLGVGARIAAQRNRDAFGVPGKSFWADYDGDGEMP